MEQLAFVGFFLGVLNIGILLGWFMTYRICKMYEEEESDTEE